MYNVEEYRSKSFKEELKELLTSSFQNSFGNLIPSSILKKLIVKDHTYLNYANRSDLNFYDLLNFAYKKELEKNDKESFSKEESDLLERYLENNSNLFDTLNIKILDEKIRKLIGDDNLELIVRYPRLEELIINLSNHEEVLNVFNFTFNNLKDNYKFQISLIEDILKKLNYRLKSNQGGEEPDQFLKLVNEKINDPNYEFSEEEKNIISYMTLTSKCTIVEDIDYSYIKNYLEIYKKERDKEFFENPSYDKFIERFFGNLIYMKFKNFNDLEEIKEKYKNVDENSSKELQLEKKALEIVELLNSVEDKPLKDKKGQEYYMDLYKKYKELGIDITSEDLLSTLTLDKYLRSSYTKKLISKIQEDIYEIKEYKTSLGKYYYIKELDKEFGRVVSVMDAYNKGSKEKNFYNRWNTRKFSENHALCYSYINESNPGVVDDKGKIIISINDFDSESLMEMSNEDMKSTTFVPSLISYGATYYTPDNLANNTRKGYSELVIELQDINKEKYQKIQPSSIICFEKVDDASIKASIELSEKLNRIIPIELIDRRKLALKEMEKIKEDYDEFVLAGSKDINLVKDIITRFHNVRNAHLNSSLKESILGEDSENKVIDEDALFSKKKMNLILEDIYLYMDKEDFSKEDIKEVNAVINKEKNYKTNAIDVGIENIFKQLEMSKESKIINIKKQIIC